MKTKSIKIIIILFVVLSYNLTYSQISGMAGAFSRMGFDAKGLSMGNSIVAYTKNNISPYYNPASLTYQEKKSFSATYTFLNLDRTLNSIAIILPVELEQQDGKVNAAIFGGLINAGVDEIDARNYDGVSTGNLSVFENQFFVGAAFKITNRISVGGNFKFNYSKLYEDVTSGGFGFDIGLLFKLNEKLSIAACLKDINTSYSWNTTNLYGQSGSTTTDKFPLLKIIGAGYQINDEFYVGAAFENSNQGTNIFRLGGEYVFNDIFALRLGIDRLDISNSKNGIKPTFGFSLSHEFSSLRPILNYVFSIEPFTHYPIQMITLTIQF
jgi:long-subunit fatty acid transport protein